MSEQTKIYVMSKVEFHEMKDKNQLNDLNVDEYRKVAFISINDSSGDYYKEPLFNQNHFNVLLMHFDDVEHEGQLSPTNKDVNKAFSKEQAKQVVEFLELNKGINTLIVHCAAGISRSGAVGRFALDYLNGNRENFKVNNPHILPNPRVARMLNEAWRNKKINK